MFYTDRGTLMIVDYEVSIRYWVYKKMNATEERVAIVYQIVLNSVKKRLFHNLIIC